MVGLFEESLFGVLEACEILALQRIVLFLPALTAIFNSANAKSFVFFLNDDDSPAFPSADDEVEFWGEFLQKLELVGTEEGVVFGRKEGLQKLREDLEDALLLRTLDLGQIMAVCLFGGQVLDVAIAAKFVSTSQMMHFIALIKTNAAFLGRDWLGLLSFGLFLEHWLAVLGLQLERKAFNRHSIIEEAFKNALKNLGWLFVHLIGKLDGGVEGGRFLEEVLKLLVQGLGVVFLLHLIYYIKILNKNIECFIFE